MKFLLTGEGVWKIVQGTHPPLPLHPHLPRAPKVLEPGLPDRLPYKSHSQKQVNTKLGKLRTSYTNNVPRTPPTGGLLQSGK